MQRAWGLLLAAWSLASLLLLVLLGAPLEEEEADLLDTHRQRMLLELRGEHGALEVARDWAARHFGRQGTQRHASAWLHYENPHAESQMASWYDTLVPQRSADDTYFAVEGTSLGYMGLQQVRGFPFFEGKVVFSMWDKGSAAQTEEDMAQVVECGRQAVCTRFGGEGTGAKSYINFYKWKLEKEYGFMTRAFDIGNGTVRYEGYLHAEELGGWVLVSKIKVHSGGLPWHITSMYSFTEQWSPRDFGQARWARLGPAFVQYLGQEATKGGAGIWTQVRNAYFTHSGVGAEDTSNVNANVTETGRQWGLGIGGNVSAGVQNTLLRVDAAESLPEPLLEFDKLVEEGSLPGGCLGGTCRGRWWKALARETFSSSNLPRTGLIALFFGITCSMSCYVFGCCGHLNCFCGDRSDGSDKDGSEDETPGGGEAPHKAPRTDTHDSEQSGQGSEKVHATNP